MKEAKTQGQSPLKMLRNKNPDTKNQTCQYLYSKN